MAVSLVAILTIKPGAREKFDAYELRAAGIVRRYGGKIEKRVFVSGEPEREVHFVAFPDEASFTAYRHDIELVSLRADREACILSTELLRGEELPPL